MRKVFAELPEACTSTLAVAERCNLELTFGQFRLPRYEVPAGQTLDSYLREVAEAGLRRHYPEPTAEVRTRLDYELGVIQAMQFSGYFLVVWDFIRYAKERGIAVGPGRGSAAASLVAYCLGITTVDPMRYGLVFERFLNPGRKSMPDMDIDFADDRRDEVIDYVVQPIRPGPGRADHHLQRAQGQGGHPGRRPGARHAVRRRRQDRQARPRHAQHHARRRLPAEPAPGRGGQGAARGRRAVADRQEARGAGPRTPASTPPAW